MQSLPISVTSFRSQTLMWSRRQEESKQNVSACWLSHNSAICFYACLVKSAQVTSKTQLPPGGAVTNKYLRNLKLLFYSILSQSHWCTVSHCIFSKCGRKYCNMAMVMKRQEQWFRTWSDTQEGDQIDFNLECQLKENIKSKESLFSEALRQHSRNSWVN